MAETIESLTLKNVTLQFEGADLLKDCSFAFPMEQNTRIVFSDDREKFFFYHAMTQIEGFTKGQYLINDKDVTEMSFEEFMPWRLKIGVGFSTRGLIHNRTLRQNLELPLQFHEQFSGPELKDWMEHCVEYFSLFADLDKRPAEVSPNAQKATLVLRAFVQQPEMVFLDTPELMLSSHLHANLLQLVDDHRKHHNLRHVFFSTYDEELSDCFVDQNIILRKKKLNIVNLKKLKRLAL